MSPAEIASSLRGRKVGKNKWVAKCPAHRERTGSLYITPGKDGQGTWLHCFAGCTQESVLNAAGLRWRDLHPGPVTAEIRQRMSAQDRHESLERELGLVYVLMAIEPHKRRYWEGAEERIQGELKQLRCVLEPKKVIREWQSKQFQRRVRRVGWEQLWREVHE